MRTNIPPVPINASTAPHIKNLPGNSGKDADPINPPIKNNAKHTRPSVSICSELIKGLVITR